MSSIRDTAVIVGSLRKDSINLKLAKALFGLAPSELRLDIVPIADLALYNQDLEADVPAPWSAFRERIRRAHAVLFVTPEYNRSVPAPLKNALDVGSRPYGKSAWNEKPAAVISASPGAMGGFGANHHLRQSLVFLNMPVLQQPEAYVGGADRLFDSDGNLTAAATREFLGKFLAAFASWIERVSPR